jgi:hypothetical protein
MQREPMRLPLMQTTRGALEPEKLPPRLSLRFPPLPLHKPGFCKCGGQDWAMRIVAEAGAESLSAFADGAA